MRQRAARIVATLLNTRTHFPLSQRVLTFSQLPLPGALLANVCAEYELTDNERANTHRLAVNAEEDPPASDAERWTLRWMGLLFSNTGHVLRWIDQSHLDSRILVDDRRV